MLTTLRITGMTCNGCVKHVDAALRKVAGVSAVEVDLTKGSAKVAHAAETTLATLVAAVVNAGYEVMTT